MKGELLGLLFVGRHPPTPAAHHPQAAAVGLDWLYAAAIGVGGSLLGGLIGGWFALRAARAQWQRQREATRADRSHQAALALAGEIARLQGAVETWTVRRDDVNALVAAFNAFSLSAAVQSIGLTDEELRRRISYHTLLAGEFSASAGLHPSGPSQAELDREVQSHAEAVRRHTEAVLEAIDAHLNGRPLPPYQPPPVDTTAES